MPPISNDELRDHLLAEYAQPFSGWDFSYLHGRRVMQTLPWDYTGRVVAALKQADTLLDMHTGGGEWLAALPRRPAITHATEGYPPNVIIARERLGPLGVIVHEATDAAHLPTDDAYFELITNRHGAYVPHELRRVLGSGGTFITQQVGDQTNRELHELLGHQKDVDPWNLRQAVDALGTAGFEIVEQHEAFPITRFFDTGAIVYYLKAIPWEIPDFSVDRYFDALRMIHERIDTEGFLDVRFHQFFIAARKT